jgi:TPR repeat protein
VAYYYGNGVIEDYIQAYAWYDIAQANGNKDAKEQKAGVAIVMTPKHITEAKKLSQEMIKANPKLIN